MSIHPFTIKSVWFYLLIMSVSLVALWLNHTRGGTVSIVFTTIAGALLLGAYLLVYNLAPETKNIIVSTIAKIKKR